MSPQQLQLDHWDHAHHTALAVKVREFVQITLPKLIALALGWEQILRALPMSPELAVSLAHALMELLDLIAHFLVELIWEIVQPAPQTHAKSINQ